MIVWSGAKFILLDDLVNMFIYRWRNYQHNPSSKKLLYSRGDRQLCSSARSLDDKASRHIYNKALNQVKTPLTSSKLGTLGSPGGHLFFEIWGKYYFFITLGFHNTNDNQLAWLTGITKMSGISRKLSFSGPELNAGGLVSNFVWRHGLCTKQTWKEQAI